MRKWVGATDGLPDWTRRWREWSVRLLSVAAVSSSRSSLSLSMTISVSSSEAGFALGSASAAALETEDFSPASGCWDAGTVSDVASAGSGRCDELKWDGSSCDGSSCDGSGDTLVLFDSGDDCVSLLQQAYKNVDQGNLRPLSCRLLGRQVDSAS